MGIRFLLMIFVAIIGAGKFSDSIASQCSVLIQCNNCTTASSWSDAAIWSTPPPPPPPAQYPFTCVAHIANLNTGEFRKYNVIKDPDLIYDPTTGEYFMGAFEVAPEPIVLSRFNDLYQALSDFQGANQQINIPPDPDLPDSAYDIPGNSQNQFAVQQYIENNHPILDTINQLVQGFLSVVDAVPGFNFSTLLTIKVNFPDGSTGLFRRTVLGLGVSIWVPVEGTFYDSEGNAIHFRAAGYAGGSGFTNNPENRQRMLDWFDLLGIQVTGPGGGVSCNWHCPTATHCILSCS